MTLQIELLGLTPYHVAYKRQMQLLKKLHDNDQEDDVCLMLEHPSIFTLGRNGTPANVTVSETFLQERGVDVLRIERGGDVTYHGPGQIVCYPVMNLGRNKLGVAEFIHTLEDIMLSVVQHFGIAASRNSKNHGIWCGEHKLGSVGIAVRHGISYHGFALNVNIDLGPFAWINPCGLPDVSMTSMEKQLQQAVILKEVESVMIREVKKAFQGCSIKKNTTPRIAKPRWLKQRLPTGTGYEKTRRLVSASGLHTVCQEARCPNQFECFGKGTATFMLLGEKCTRSCRFCAITHADPDSLDPEEPARIAKAVHEMGLQYAVLTSVTRDDLSDGGAEHFALTVEAIRKLCPETLIELLIPDMQGKEAALAFLCQHKPSVLNHNIETVASLYPEVRPQAIYERSLELLENVKKYNPSIVTKSGLMLGLGETEEELTKTMADIKKTGCNLLTLGQYLQPTPKHLAVNRYVRPEEFAALRETALKLGFAGVAAGPHVRSSYQAEELYKLAI
jgi:lipoic acid synthetase